MSKVKRIELNFLKTQQVYEYFYSKEELLGICRDYKNSLVFKGGVDLEFGSGLFSSTGLKNPDEQRNTINLLQRALDYKDMFGMCPYKVKRDEITLLPRIIIPEFGFGKFVLLVPKNKLETKVEYELFNGKGSLKVFVWPGLGPSLTGEFKSKIFKLYAAYVELREYGMNALDADYELTHPTVITQHKIGDTDITKLTESELYGDADPDDLNPDENALYRRSVFRSRILEAEMRMMRNPTQSSIPTKDTKNSMRYDSIQNKLVYHQRGDIMKDRLYQLETGEELVKQQIPVIGNQIKDLKLEYQHMVCLAFGTPRDYLMANKGMLKSNTIKEREIIQTRVEDDRQAAGIFYQFVYDQIYREEDNRKLVNVLMQLDGKKRKLAVDDKERMAIKNQKQRIKKIAKSKNRIKLKFQEDPFKDTIDANSILIGADRGYITREEEISLYRAHLGLPEVSIKILDKDKEAREKQKLESEEKMQQVHQNGKRDLERDKGEEPPQKKQKNELEPPQRKEPEPSPKKQKKDLEKEK